MGGKRQIFLTEELQIIHALPLHEPGLDSLTLERASLSALPAENGAGTGRWRRGAATLQPRSLVSLGQPGGEANLAMCRLWEPPVPRVM